MKNRVQVEMTYLTSFEEGRRSYRTTPIIADLEQKLRAVLVKALTNHTDGFVPTPDSVTIGLTPNDGGMPVDIDIKIVCPLTTNGLANLDRDSQDLERWLANYLHLNRGKTNVSGGDSITASLTLTLVPTVTRFVAVRR